MLELGVAGLGLGVACWSWVWHVGSLGVAGLGLALCITLMYYSLVCEGVFFVSILSGVV